MCRSRGRSGVWLKGMSSFDFVRVSGWVGMMMSCPLGRIDRMNSGDRFQAGQKREYLKFEAEIYNISPSV